MNAFIKHNMPFWSERSACAALAQCLDSFIAEYKLDIGEAKTELPLVSAQLRTGFPIIHY
jgi:hypothetical protein